MRETGSQLQRFASMFALWLLSFGMLPKIALTQDNSDPMEFCYHMSDSAARLSCFDKEMQRRHATLHQKSAAPTAASAPTAPSTTTSMTTARTRAPDDTVGLDGRQLMLKRKAENIHIDPPEPMVVTLTHLTQHPGHQYSFELDNGQVWESTDAEGDLFLGPHETVTIRPGVLGAFFLKTQTGLSIRVHRLR
jgi:hypothetical protein